MVIEKVRGHQGTLTFFIKDCSTRDKHILYSNLCFFSFFHKHLFPSFKSNFETRLDYA